MSGFLDAVAKALGSLSSRTERNGNGAWWVTVVVALLAVVGLAIGWYVMRRNGRELAKLRIEKFDSDLAAAQKRIDDDAHVLDDEAVAAEARAAEAKRKAEDIDARLAAARRQHADDLAAISRVRSWRDVAGAS